MIELRLKVEIYINFEEVLQVVDDLDLFNLGIIREATKDLTLAQLKSN